jgi:hypothetical protein
VENNKNIDILESVVVKEGDVMISICGDPEGILAGKTSDQMLMFCADVLHRAAGEGTIEESFEMPETIRETLVLNYGWSDLEYNEFVKVWRKNMYLKKIGSDNQIPVDLEEYNRFLAYLDRKKKKELGEIKATSEADEEVIAEELEKAESEKKNEGTVASVAKSVRHENGAVFIEGERVSEINLETMFEAPQEQTQPTEEAKTEASPEEFVVEEDKAVKKPLKKVTRRV